MKRQKCCFLDEARIAGNNAYVYDGVSVEDGFVNWVQEMRLNYGAKWSPYRGEVAAFIDGYFGENERDLPEIDELYQALYINRA